MMMRRRRRVVVQPSVMVVLLVRHDSMEVGVERASFHHLKALISLQLYQKQSDDTYVTNEDRRGRSFESCSLTSVDEVQGFEEGSRNPRLWSLFRHTKNKLLFYGEGGGPTNDKSEGDSRSK
jgi:hypothetical protein